MSKDDGRCVIQGEKMRLITGHRADQRYLIIRLKQHQASTIINFLFFRTIGIDNEETYCTATTGSIRGLYSLLLLLLLLHTTNARPPQLDECNQK